MEKKIESYLGSAIIRIVKQSYKTKHKDAEEETIEGVANLTMRYMNDFSYIMFDRFVIDEIVRETEKLSGFIGKDEKDGE